uniref:Serine/threonine protein kinase n=1 Tax=Planktothricoides sp. SpSt-374 TaxID=2282167 RepID=A0A7C3ZPU8_9CYAN
MGNLSKYRILKLVGQGQFGRVFCAVERQTGQLVALKELTHRRLSTSKFLRELGTLLTLQHQNIVKAFALEQTPNARYLVMDYCAGGTLRDLLEQKNALNLGEALLLMRLVLAGLDTAHRQGIIHCDIKPENILLTLRNGSWWPELSDFGIARRLSELQQDQKVQGSGQGSIEAVGAPAYTPPEGFYGIYSQAADIYAMGIVMFEMLLGHRPFSGVPQHLMWAHLNQRIEWPAHLPPQLQEILQKALAKLPGRRYSKAAQMAAAIAQVEQDPQVRELMGTLLPLPSSGSYWAAGVKIKPLLISPPVQLQFFVARNSWQQNGCLYGAISGGSSILMWERRGDNIGSNPVVVNLPAPVIGLCAAHTGVLVQLQSGLGNSSPSLCWLQPKDGGSGVDYIPFQFPARNLWGIQPPSNVPRQSYTQAAVDADGRWLAVLIAAPGQNLEARSDSYILELYALNNSLLPPERSSFGNLEAPKRQQQLQLATTSPPQLLFLDDRHLAIVHQTASTQSISTKISVWTRRLTLVGSVELPLELSGLQPLPQPPGSSAQKSQTPVVLVGVTKKPTPALWRIQLLPLQLRRYPLPVQPNCGTPGMNGEQEGYILAAADGQMWWLDVGSGSAD